jgi:hypothetical protein
VIFCVAPSVGDHVRLRETHPRLFAGDVRAGTWGIVRDTHYGLLTSDVVIELADGAGRVTLPARKVRRTGGSGERGLELRRDWRRAKLFAGVLLALPALLALARFLLAGGHLSELVLPMMEEAAVTAVALVTGPYGSLIIIAFALVALRRKLGSASRPR